MARNTERWWVGSRASDGDSAGNLLVVNDEVGVTLVIVEDDVNLGVHPVVHAGVIEVTGGVSRVEGRRSSHGWISYSKPVQTQQTNCQWLDHEAFHVEAGLNFIFVFLHISIHFLFFKITKHGDFIINICDVISTFHWNTTDVASVELLQPGLERCLWLHCGTDWGQAWRERGGDGGETGGREFPNHCTKECLLLSNKARDWLD